MSVEDDRDQAARKLEGPMAGGVRPHLDANAFRALVIDGVVQLLTNPELGPLLDKLFTEMDYGTRAWQSFSVTKITQARVTARLAKELRALAPTEGEPEDAE